MFVRFVHLLKVTVVRVFQMGSDEISDAVGIMMGALCAVAFDNVQYVYMVLVHRNLIGTISLRISIRTVSSFLTLFHCL